MESGFWHFGFFRVMIPIKRDLPEHMSLLEDDYDTFVTVLLSVIEDSAGFADMVEDFEVAVQSIASDGALPGSAALRTEEFLTSLYQSITKKLLGFPSLPRGELDSVKSLLAATLVLGAKGFERKSVPMVESAYHILYDKSSPLYRSHATDNLLDYFSSEFKRLGGFESAMAALCTDELQGDLLFWAGWLVLKRDSTADLSLLSCHMAASILKEVSANPKSLNRQFQLFFGELSDLLTKSQISVAAEWFTLFDLLLQAEIFENRRISLAILSQLAIDPIQSPSVISFFQDRGIDGIVILELHTEFLDPLQKIYRLFAIHDLLNEDMLDLLWSNQEFNHVSVQPVFYGILETVAQHLQPSLVQPYISFILSPGEKTLNWINFVGRCAASMLKNDSLRPASDELRNRLIDFSLSEPDDRLRNAA
jgi:hypothetical protein